MDLTALNLEQLESLAFKQIIARDNAQNNLNLVLAEMKNREPVKKEDENV